MGPENEQDIFEEVEEPSINNEVGVKDAAKFIEAMLDFFRNKGTLYISSYDFGDWPNRLAHFKSASRVRTKPLFMPPSILENGYNLTDEFINVFVNECLKNIDAQNTLNQFVIYEKGSPLLQCYGNFEIVLVNAKVPKRIINTLAQNNVITFWGKPTSG